MKIINETPLSPGWTQGFAPDGRELVVVAVRGTYDLQVPGSYEPALAAEQLPPIEADVFGDDPALDAPRQENDYGLFKPRCDVLFSGKAHAPPGRPVTELDVALRVGACQKSFRVTGPRVWSYNAVGGATASPPVAFTSQELSYDVAYGGTDVDPADPTQVRTYIHNPCGTGYCEFRHNLEGMPIAITEEFDAPITSPTGNYRPMALGPIGRNWWPRYSYAGTYDKLWRETKLPFLPDDFDYQYFQAAPLDQQIPYPVGGEPIALINLSAGNQLTTSIPRQSVSVVFVRKVGEATTLTAKLDTVILEPELNRLSLVWRATCPMKRDAFELREMVVLDGSPEALARDRARRMNKPYYANLDEAVRAKKKGGR